MGEARRANRDLGDGARAAQPGWFVRRVGLARSSTVACVLGLALAGCGTGEKQAALAGLAIAVVAGAAAIWGTSRAQGLRARRVWRWLLIISLLLIGFFSGQFWGGMRIQTLGTSALQTSVGEWVTARLTVVGEVRSSQGWQSALAVVESVDGLAEEAGRSSDAAGEKVLLEIPPVRSGDGQSTVCLEEGLVLTCQARVVTPETGSNAGGYDQRRHLLCQGAKLVLRARAPDSVEIIGRRGGLRGLVDSLRRTAGERLSRGPDERVSEVLKGAVLGDTSGMDRGWLESFRRAGTAHMFAVSGLHVGSLAMLVLGVARLIGAPRWTGFVLALLVAFFMVPFAGGSPSVLRAAVMIGVAVVGRWLGRGRDPWQVLALAAAVVLALNPFALFDPGFQLSFAALGGLLLLTKPLEKSLCRLPRTLRSNLAVSLATCVGTAPVSLAVFGRTSLVSPLANLLVVPLLPLVVGGGMTSLVLGLIWEGFSTVADYAVAIPLSWTILVSQLCALVPVLDTKELGRALFALAMVAATLPVSLALSGRQVPTPFRIRFPLFGRVMVWVRRHRPSRASFAWTLAVGLLVATLALSVVLYPLGARALGSLRWAAAGRQWPAAAEATVLDVGQGNAVLVRTPARHALLFDAGPAGCDLADKLLARGVKRLDLVVVSHPHADHFAGLLEALGRVEVGVLADHVRVVPDPAGPLDSAAEDAGRGKTATEGSNGSANDASSYVELRRALEQDQHCEHLEAGQGSTLSVDGISVRFYAPSSPLVLASGAYPWAIRGAVPSGEELNALSLVAVVSVAGWDLLLPGDAEAEVLQGYALPPVEVLVAPHHGSKGGVTSALLGKLRPQVAIVSVGKDNPFGHPAKETMDALNDRVATVLRTDLHGWVSCELRDNGLAVTAERTIAE